MSESPQAGSALPSEGGLRYLATMAGVLAHTQLPRRPAAHPVLFPATQEKEVERTEGEIADGDEDEEDLKGDKRHRVRQLVP